MTENEKNTELKIKEAARILFQQKGFAAVKTREIAESADINLALLNYYFRSKKNLFNIIMLETMQEFFSGIVPILNNSENTIREKMMGLVDRYIEMLTENPDVIIFIVNEIRANPEDFIHKVGVLKDIKNSMFSKQFKAELEQGNVPNINPIHFLMNFVGLIVFPFVASPMISTVTGLSKEELMEIIQERKTLIPLWMDAMLSVSQ